MSSNHGIRLCLLEPLITVPLRPQHHGLDVEMGQLGSVIDANQHLFFCSRKRVTSAKGMSCSELLPLMT